MSQPEPERALVKVAVPDVIHKTVAVAGATIHAAGLVPAFVDRSLKAVEDPPPGWYVQTDGEHPNRGTLVDVGSIVLLTIGASSTGGEPGPIRFP
jgi:beta-lactam-binding protein with PASTA domain